MKKSKKIQTAAVKSKAPAKENFRSTDLLPALLLGLYLLTGVIPNLGAVKISGTQWLYLAIINIAGLIYLFSEKDKYYPAARAISRNTFSYLLAAFVLVTGLSILVAFNKVESMVTYARIITTVLAFLIVATTLYLRPHLFRVIALFLSVLLLLESISTLSTFFKGLGTEEFDKLILSLTGNAGNKNIHAAGILIKIPFAIYVLRNSKLAGKLVTVLAIGLASLAIFIINSRAAFLGLFGVMVLFVISEILNRQKTQEGMQYSLKQIAWAVVPVIFAFLLSQQVLKNAIETQGSTGFGTVTERLGTISLSEKGTTARTFLWGNAISYIKQHPLSGAGYGNWKIQAVQYDRYFYDDYILSYYVHNDFLEFTAETGLAGGLLYLSLFICLAIYVIRTWIANPTPDQRQPFFFAFMALSVYFVDAVLNFPHEIPFMQVMFVTVAGVILSHFLKRPGKPVATVSKSSSNFPVILVICLLLSLITAWFALRNYRSTVVQYEIDKDLAKTKPELKSDYVLNNLPSIPNLSARALPLDHYRAIYLELEKKYPESMRYLDKDSISSPYIAVNNLMRSRIYTANKQFDSAYTTAVKGFFDGPRARAALQALNVACYNKRDTVMLMKGFREFIKYRPEAWAWNEYLRYMEGMINSRERLVSIADSALKLFPDDPDLKQKMANYAGGIINSPGTTNTSNVNIVSGGNKDTSIVAGGQNTSVVDSAYINKSNEIFKKAQDAYAKADYKTSIKYMLEFSERNKSDYRPLENVGFAYYAMSDFKNAIVYFEKVIAMKTSKDGKTEYYLANSYNMMNNDKKTACKYFQLSMQKKYPEAKGSVDIYCKDSTSQTP